MRPAGHWDVVGQPLLQLRGDPGGGETLGGGGDPGEEGETLGCYSQCTEENVWRVLKNNIQVFLAIIFASFVH